MFRMWGAMLQRELGDISSAEYAAKMVHVRKRREQEFFDAGFDQSMIELLLDLELDMDGALRDRTENNGL